ncbi:hypothetical protein BS78_06G163100 [Paspalum vaginatum]|nr:hypothetical protein BS78_06G163100 [Paspalum vaginatum]
MAATSSSSSVATQLNLPPGYRFVPEDKELVGDYLVPRLLGYALPANEILDVDPLSAPPPLLLKAHGRRRRQDAFFFAEGQAKDSRGSRQRRTCEGGGMWQGQTTLVANEWLRVPLPGGGSGAVQWRKKSFNFHEDKSGSTGWVMHEYAVTAPPDLAASLLRVYRIRCSGHGKNAKKKRKRGAPQDSDSDEDEGAPAHASRANTQQSDVAAEGNAAPFVAVGEYPLAAQRSADAEPLVDPSNGGNPPDATDGKGGIAELLDKEVDWNRYASKLIEDAPIIPERYIDLKPHLSE